MVLAPSPKHSLDERKGMERRGSATPCAQPLLGLPVTVDTCFDVHLKRQWVGPVLCPAPRSSQSPAGLRLVPSRSCSGFRPRLSGLVLREPAGPQPAWKGFLLLPLYLPLFTSFDFFRAPPLFSLWAQT